MTVPNFPSNPANGATVTENGITYTFNSNGGGTNIGFWEASGEAINLQSVTDNGNETTNTIVLDRPDNSRSYDTHNDAGNSVARMNVNGDGSGSVIVNNEDGTARITLNGETGNIDIANGNLVFGTAGGGIDFSINTGSQATGASTTSELIDHYEEGTWTPTVTGTSGAAFTVGSINAQYIRVGSLVTVVASYTCQMTSGANVFAKIGGLPYVRRAGTPFYGWPKVNNGGSSWNRQNSEQCFLSANSSLLSANAGLQAGLAATGFWPASTNVEVQFSMTYITT